MYGFEESTPRNCKECKEYCKIRLTYDDKMVGCMHGSKMADIRKTSRPADCPIVDM